MSLARGGESVSRWHGAGGRTLYLGVDIGGSKNTWICGLHAGRGDVTVGLEPTRASLAEIVMLAREGSIDAVAIDAQLTASVASESGFRASDQHLRELLAPAQRSIVASQNSLMAVPVRGRQLAEALSPLVGTIIETHPGACLALGLPQYESAVASYKHDEHGQVCRILWESWCLCFGLSAPLSGTAIISDGALDALVCASVAYLFHHRVKQLLRLRHSQDSSGRGPFYVVQPGR